jgi:serine/threonine protein phosphatase PrpC
VIRTFGLSDKGPARPVNEDCFATDETLGLCVVADGIGGHNAGEVAARITVDTIVEALRAADRSAQAFARHQTSPHADLLRTAIQLASDRIRNAALVERQYAGMGTTVVAVRVAGNRLSVAYAGDSRLYVLSRGCLRQVTHDDSWLASVVAQDPDVDQAALEHHPMRHALTNVVGAMMQTTVHVVEESIDAGDTLLLSTDGVHGVLDDWRLERILLQEDEPRAIAEHLVRAAVARGSGDDRTVVVAAVS